MCALMTFVTRFKFTYHVFAVRCFMALYTSWNNSMLVGMTENTLEFCMFGGPCLQGLFDIGMTSSTITVTNTCVVGKCERLMGLVTFYTVFKLLAFAMYFMAIQTIRFVSVDFMTE